MENLEENAHVVQQLPEQLFGNTTVEMNAKLCDQISQQKDVEKVASAFCISLNKYGNVVKCQGNWLNIRLFESNLKDLMSLRWKKFTDETSLTHTDGDSTRKHAQRLERGLTSTLEHQEVACQSPQEKRIATDPSLQSSATLKLSLTDLAEKTGNPQILERVRSSSDPPRHSPSGSGAVSKAGDIRNTWGSEDSDCERRAHRPLSKPQQDDAQDSADEEIVDASSVLHHQEKSKGVGRDGTEAEEYADAHSGNDDMDREGAGCSHQDVSQGSDEAKKTGPLLRLIPGARKQEHIYETIDDVNGKESDAQLAEEHGWDKGEPMYDTGDGRTEPAKVDHDKAGHEKGVHEVAVRSGVRKRVLDEPAVEEKKPVKFVQSAFYNHQIQETPIMCAHLELQRDILERVESKYGVIIRISDDIEISGDDQQKISSAEQRLGEVIKGIKGEIEVEISKPVPEVKTDMIKEFVKSRSDSIACVFDEESRSVLCMGEGAEGIITEVNELLLQHDEYREVVYMDDDVMKYIGYTKCMPEMDTGETINMRPEDEEGMGRVTITGKMEERVKSLATKMMKLRNDVQQDIMKDQVEIKTTDHVDVKKLDKEFSDVLVDLNKDCMLVELLGPTKRVKAAKKRIMEILKEQGSGARETPPRPEWSHSTGSATDRPPMSFKSTTGKLVVHALVHDITKMRVDIIVNAANDRLDHGGGVALAIAKAAGKDLVDDCTAYIKKNKPIKVTNHYLSKPGKLQCKKVMHAVGPIWGKDGKNEKSSQQLRETFKKCLESAEEYSSIAMPPVSAGIFGGSPYGVAVTLAKCIGLFARTSKGTLTDIYLVDVSPQTVQMIQKQLKQQKSLKQLDAFTGGRACHSRQDGRSRKRELFEDDSTTKKQHSGEAGKSSEAAAGDRSQWYDGARTPGVHDMMQHDPSFAGTYAPPRDEHPDDKGDGKTTWYDKEKEPGQEKPGEDRPADSSQPAPEEEEPGDCPICLSPIEDLECLSKCRHKFCKDCIKQCFKNKPVCPICGVVYGKIRGNQPKDGKMKHYTKSSLRLPGYEKYGAIVIEYDFNGGTQTDEHPNPGKYYSGTSRRAFLPDCPEGRIVLGLLKQAFEARLIFTIGTSVTSGMENTVTWNDIHHKTNPHGGPQRYGYPDPTYLSRVKQELAAKGITF